MKYEVILIKVVTEDVGAVLSVLKDAVEENAFEEAIDVKVV